MNKIERLIKELCPNGVEWEEIGKIIDYEQPTKYLVSSKEYNDNYELPVLTAGQTFILGYTNETEGIYQASKENPVIIFDDFTTSKKWVDFNFKVKSTAMKILKVKSGVSNILIRYVWHYLGTITYSPDQHGRQWISTYSKFKIPIPPLEIQEEIVKILDKFTDYVTELTTELTLRQKQYNYYRDKLLSLEEDKNYQLVQLGTICEIGDGLHGTPKYNDFGDYYFINGNNILNGNIVIKESTKKVSIQDNLKLLKNLDESILISINGTIGNVAYYSGEKVVLGKSVAYLKVKSDNIDLSYLYYYLQTSFSKNYFEANLTGSTIKNLGLKALRGMNIILPSLDRQKKLVSILLKFNQISNDISTGLPKEIELRQKQYEYYRDKLLSFD